MQTRQNRKGTPGSRCARRLAGLFLGLILILSGGLIPLAHAAPSTIPDTAATTATVETTWKLLDYVAVDYDGAVKDGRIVSTGEFSEMQEFTATIAQHIGALPENPAKAKLETGAKVLQQLVAQKASAQQIATASHALSAAMLDAYPVPIAPQSIPDLARGAALFRESCAACHGMNGDGKGPDAAKLSTPPIAFTDVERARKRSVAALEQVISQGIDGTAMQSFADLPVQDRWALAFYAGHFAFSPDQVERGKQIWTSDADIRSRFPDLKTLVTTTPAALGKDIGQGRADAVMAYLRAHPEAVTQTAGGTAGSLDLVRSRLAESLAAYREGDRTRAEQLALSAYLDGFEPIEPLLGASDASLLSTIETRMGELRAAIDDGDPVSSVEMRIDAIEALLSDAGTALSPEASNGTSAFVGAFTILLREGLEALLIVVAMLAFLRKAEQDHALRYVHGGWMAALLAGAATWLAATYFISISGASRELTEGLGSLLAAVVLLSVGIWMHGKSQADQWQRYIREKLAGAMNRESNWFLFGLAFVVVYREVFETILFYAALWAQGNGAAMFAGAVGAIGTLAALAWAMMRYSRSLPVGTFFRYSSWLMAVLTVILAGKGVAALQEAGWIDIAPLHDVPRLSIFGLFPTIQTVAAQALAALAIILGFLMNGRPSRKPVVGRDLDED
ncbi:MULTISPECIES: cytochrome c/FTR1 family iron permease [Novosphingobium]|uniref:Cytochrome c/FTR1 family iron permease n=1 Tax=Novosphingobium mangrovi (ex Huang et al. 2023) TaxID=2976432 RepID=A0ABT2I5N7_9SPHN|nr:MULTISPECIES: cytochrome c/FTR1 family iron permease [Novosphingobium]MCT2400118.1 cytochrome c/FTR1 family iron permease [Novosphingobium mangrovi (ex Huang et al. 2023)]CCA93116.1 iron permease FTR1 [Novosphingobium sp. PP1Y]